MSVKFGFFRKCAKLAGVVITTIGVTLTTNPECVTFVEISLVRNMIVATSYISHSPQYVEKL